MAKFHLKTPFTEEDIRKLNVGDIVVFDGTLFGIRDLTQIYMFDQNHEPPVSLEGMPCIHTAPSLKNTELKKGGRPLGAHMCWNDHQCAHGSIFSLANREAWCAGHHRKGRPV
jgi:hypothetical protein